MKGKLDQFIYSLLIFIPISIYFGWIAQNHTLAFITSIISFIPLAHMLGHIIQEVSLQTNPTVSGLLSATFGNSIELIIAVNALSLGLIRVVEASIIGSIIGNVLLLIGASIFFGGIKHKHQKFNARSVGVSSTMLIIAVVGLALPSVYAVFNPNSTQITLLSESVAVVFALIYLASIFITLKTHKNIFDSSDELKATHQKPTLSLKKAIFYLILVTAIVALESEFLVAGLQEAGTTLGLSETFIGIVIIAVITNIAEKGTAIKFALDNKIDLALEIGLSSAIQIALFVAPILILISEIFGFGFTLVFSMFEVISLFFAVMIINYLSSDGKCNWLEGAQLMTVYALLAIAFFFL